MAAILSGPQCVKPWSTCRYEEGPSRLQLDPLAALRLVSKETVTLLARQSPRLVQLQVMLGGRNQPEDLLKVKCRYGLFSDERLWWFGTWYQYQKETIYHVIMGNGTPTSMNLYFFPAHLRSMQDVIPHRSPTHVNVEVGVTASYTHQYISETEATATGMNPTQKLWSIQAM